MMITKRQYIVTLLIFLVLLLLFMGFQLGKSAVTASARHKELAPLSGEETGAGRPAGFLPLSEAGTREEEEWMLYVGREDSEFASVVREWAYYTGTAVAIGEKLPDPGEAGLPGAVMLEPDFVPGNADALASLMDRGVDVIFLALPGVDAVSGDETLRELLGIHRILREQVTLRGVHLFEGFLLGGERIFESAPGEEERQDLELQLPWYSVRTGTKTFLRGILSEEDLASARERKLKNEDMPAILWRSHYGEGEAYAVCGDFLKNRKIGMGMLQAITYERRPCLLYPVVNAQVFSLENFPLLANENAARMEEIYGRSAARVQADIILPMLITLSAKNELHPSCFLSPKILDSDPAVPDAEALADYRNLIAEMDGELGWREGRSGAPLSDGSEAGRALARALTEDGRITAVMADADQGDGLAGRLTEEGFGDLRTVTPAAEDQDRPLLGYFTPGITCQQLTWGLTEHSFTQELELLGVQTLLAYSNAGFDMASVFDPESEEQEWQNASRRVFSNLTTYLRPFEKLDRLTASESDARVRAYLSMDFTQTREDDCITLTLDAPGEGEPAWFLLRTHGEEVAAVRGGRAEKLETGAYLIAAEEREVEIRLASVLAATVDMEGRNR